MCLNSKCKQRDDLCRDHIGLFSDGQCVQNGSTCLMQASSGGHLDVVKYLHEAGGEKLLMVADKVSACSYCVLGRQAFGTFTHIWNGAYVGCCRPTHAYCRHAQLYTCMCP